MPRGASAWGGRHSLWRTRQGYGVRMISSGGVGNGFPGWLLLVVVVLGIWEAVWKGVGLWHAGRDRNLLWFVLMFVLNTVGILEIIYVFAISRPKRASEGPSPAP